MHILFVSREYLPSLRAGGIATYLKNVAEALVLEGYQVTVIRASDDTRVFGKEIINGVHVISLSGGDFNITEIEGPSLIKKFRALYRFHSYRYKIKKNIGTLKDIDVIEIAEFGAEGLFLQNLQIPVIYRLHTPVLLNHSKFSLKKLSLSNCYYYYQGVKELSLLKRARYINSCSTGLSEWISENVGINKSGIQVIYNPIDANRVKVNFNKYEGSHSSFKQILFAGTVCDWKGAADLVEAGKILAKQNIFFQLEMIGKTGDFGEVLKQQNLSLKWLNIIGKLPHDELMQKYNRADVVCFPSWWENMPMVCIEAMMCGAIVIGSSSGGMSEIITDGKDGFLLKPHDPQVWANKINYIFSLSKEERLQISYNAQKKIKEKFDIKIIIPQIITYYKDVIINHKKE